MKPVLIGMTCYDGHVDTFLNMCLPSLMGEGNLPALAKEREIIFHIHTKENDFTRLMGCTEYKWEIVCDATESEKYSQLGYHQNADLLKAKRMGADYICLMPDFIYSENCFRGMLKVLEKGHKAIGRLNLSAKMEPMIEVIKPNMSALDLATLGLKHIHPGIQNWLITPTGYPATHVICYVGEKTLSMHSPHIHPLYIVNEVINPIDSKLPLDSILNKVVIGDIYCPKPEDEIVIVELTPEANREPQLAIVNEEEFVRIFKSDTGNSLKQLAIFEQGTVDVIRRDPSDNNFWEDKEIARIKEIVHNALIKNVEVEHAISIRQAT